jgi:hypothetical protein
MLTALDPLQKASALWVIAQVKFITGKVEDAAGACLLCNDKMVHRNALSALNSLKTPRCLGYVKFLGPVFEEEA